MLSAIATDIKDFSLSPDGKEAKFVLVTKYAGDIEVTMPSGCLNALQLNPARPASLAPQTPATASANGGSGIATAAAAGVSATPSSNPATAGVAVSVPKTWLVAADARRGLVVVVLNHRIDGQLGFALEAKGALEVASAMKKQADTLTARNDIPQA